MNSVISQEQLDIILASTKDSISINKVINSISSTHRLSAEERQSIYHNMLDITKSSNSKEISSYVLEQIQYFLNKKGNDLIEMIDNSYNQSTESQISTSNKTSPIFRRVG